MANVLHPHIDFPPRPVAHAPSPFGFGFGLGSSSSTSMLPPTGWDISSLGHTNPASFQQLASSMTQSASSKSSKRNRENDEVEQYSSNSRDESMDGSPKPESPKAGPAKRHRPASSTPEDDRLGKRSASHNNLSPNDVDIGILLASVPTDELLPLILKLLEKYPASKDMLLPLIPRPNLEKAISILKGLSEKLAQSVPYSSQPNGSRPTYSLGRIRSPVNDYVSSCLSYIPHFSSSRSIPQLSSHPGTSQNNAAATVPRYAIPPTLQESFTFFKAVTEQILTHDSLCQEEILKTQHLGDRLKAEWEAWRIKKQQEVLNGRLDGFNIIVPALHNLAASISRVEPGTKRHEFAQTICRLRDWIDQGGGMAPSHQQMEH